jgi:hypothetical protein
MKERYSWPNRPDRSAARKQHKQKMSEINNRSLVNRRARNLQVQIDHLREAVQAATPSQNRLDLFKSEELKGWSAPDLEYAPAEDYREEE